MEAPLSTQVIVITLIASLLSGLIGAAVSMWYFYKLERHKLKLDLARRLLGNRFSITGDAFSCAMNEVIAVFADSEEVLSKMGRLYEALQTLELARFGSIEWRSVLCVRGKSLSHSPT